MTLSGGEAQWFVWRPDRAGLTGVLYVLDEPSIVASGDNDRLLNTLSGFAIWEHLVVVEHDEDTIRAADHVVDIGPGAGVHGGHIGRGLRGPGGQRELTDGRFPVVAVRFPLQRNGVRAARSLG